MERREMLLSRAGQQRQRPEQAKIEELREMLIRGCGKQPPENAEKE